MTEPGRNDSCPCGSGRKYKQCHGKPAQPAGSSEERAWQDLRRALDGYPEMMLRFVCQVYGDGAVHEAWSEFLLWPDDDPGFHADTPFMQLFMPWFFHRWAPDPYETSVENADVHDRTPTSVLLTRRGRRLDPRLRSYLEACAEAPFSFHEIVRCEPGVGFHTRDLFVGTEHEVSERSASRTMRVGDSFFGQVVTSDDVTLMEACGPHVVPPGERIGLIEFRERTRAGASAPTPETLVEWDMELRGAYLDITDALLHPAPPMLRNTDGEDIEFHRVSFEIGSAQEAFDALKHLALDQTEDELLETAELDEEGRVRRVSLPWTVAGNRLHEEWDNTVLGHLEIDGTRLVAEVNSAERAARLLRIVGECLGDDARHEGTDVQSVEEALAESEAAGHASAPSETSDLAEHPEVREHLRELTRAHYESWVSESIPGPGRPLTPGGRPEPVGPRQGEGPGRSDRAQRRAAAATARRRHRREVAATARAFLTRVEPLGLRSGSL